MWVARNANPCRRGNLTIGFFYLSIVRNIFFSYTTGIFHLSMSKILRQKVTFSVPPSEVYQALMDSRKHSKFTGAKATMSQKIGGAFTAYDGSLLGENVLLTKDKLIIQSWRTTDWPRLHLSTVIFQLKKNAEGGTTLQFTQIGIPPGEFADIEKGWTIYYWEPMKKFFAAEAKRST